MPIPFNIDPKFAANDPDAQKKRQSRRRAAEAVLMAATALVVVAATATIVVFPEFLDVLSAWLHRLEGASHAP